MAQDYSPSLVTKSLVFCGDAAMKSAAGPATLLYDKVNNNNGTMYNGSCIDFDGTDDQVNIPSSSDFDLTGSFTWSFWANATSTTHEGWLFGRGGYGETGYWGIRIDSPSWELQVDWASINGATGYWLTDATLDAGSWVHISVTFDGSTAKIYKNGAFVDSQATSTAPGSGSQPLTIGYRDGNSNPFNGDMADVRLYDAPLSAANVKEIYDDSKVIIPTKNDASGGFVTQTNLKGWWPLVEGAGALCYDGSGNGNTGTITNGEDDEWLTGQTGCPQLVEGYNRPMLFPGATTEYVAVGNSSEFCFGTSSFSFGAWIKSSYTGDFQNIFDATNFASSPNKGWQLDTKTTTGMRLWLTTGSSNSSLDTSTQVTDGQWHHVGFTWYGGSPNLATIYVDGSADTSSGAMGSIDQDGGAYAASIGFQVEGTNYPFNGLINEVVLYDALLSSSEMAALAATGPNGGPLPPDPMSGASNLSAASNVKGYWRNDGDVTWTDRSGEGNNGTVAGSPDILLFKQGINGQKNVNTGRDNQGFPLLYKDVGAMGFNGSDDQITFGSFTAPDGEANLTISAWVKAGSVSSSHHRIFSKEAIIYVGRVAGNLSMYVGNGSVWTESSASLGSVTAGEWMHVVYIKDGTTGRTYINGANTGLTFTTLATLGTNAVTAYIGSSSTVQYWDGQIADVQIYNRALTYTEIQQNYNSFKARFGE
jgi:hypothetical protein